MVTKGKKSLSSKKVLKSNTEDKSMQKQAVEAFENVKEKFHVAQKHLEKQIKENPKKAILIAGAIGIALGGITVYALTRKKKK
jgi:ElaB/YqjD/DUF883 family membrane-anchored ribosome-binding protein